MFRLMQEHVASRRKQAMSAWWRSCITLLAGGVGLAGCFPVLVPAPSEKDPVPYTEVDLASIQPQQTTRSELLAKLGEPLLERRGRQLAIYGAVQKTGVQAVLFLFPAPVPLGGDAKELAHYLFVQFGEDDVVNRLEVLRGEGCTGDGLCIDHGTSVDEAARGGWYMDDKRMAAERAVVYETGTNAEIARMSKAAIGECVLFVYQARGLFKGLPAYFTVDDRNRSPISPKAFALLRIAVGSHRLVAELEGCYGAAELPIECHGGTPLYVEIASKMPPLFKQGFTAQARLIEPGEGAGELAGRGVLLAD
jgi:hypothetical protein